MATVLAVPINLCRIFSGDGKADMGCWFSNGSWSVAVTNSAGTGTPGAGPWASGHGVTSVKRFVGDVNGDNKSDEAFFFPSNGHWDNGMSSGTGFYPADSLGRCPRDRND
jgi:hypothetical protein